MTPEEIELCGALASVLDGPEEHVLGTTDARLVVRALRIAAAAAWAIRANAPIEPKAALAVAAE